MPMPDDAELRARWLGELVDERAAALALYAAQWTSAPEDCVQEALIALAAERPWPASPVAWLYRVVRRRALNQARGEARRERHEQSAWRERLKTGAGDRRHELLDAINGLPAEQREVVLLKIWGGLTFAEVACVAGGSAATAQRRYTAAIERLRTLWDVPCPNTTKTN